jgi:hypothetical protein
MIAANDLTAVIGRICSEINALQELGSSSCSNDRKRWKVMRHEGRRDHDD